MKENILDFSGLIQSGNTDLLVWQTVNRNNSLAVQISFNKQGTKSIKPPQKETVSHFKKCNGCWRVNRRGERGESCLSGSRSIKVNHDA